MLLFLYLCTGFMVSTAVVSLANVVAFAWHGTRARMDSGTSGNVRGRALGELVLGWAALAMSLAGTIELVTLYP